MSLRNLFIALFVSTLMGCGHTLIRSDSLEIPANLSTPCPMLQHLADGQAGTILKWDVAAAKQYAECQSRHKRLLEAWPK